MREVLRNHFDKDKMKNETKEGKNNIKCTQMDESEQRLEGGGVLE